MGLDQIAAAVGAVDGRRVAGRQTHVRVRVADAREHVRATVDVEVCINYALGLYPT